CKSRVSAYFSDICERWYLRRSSSLRDAIRASGWLALESRGPSWSMSCVGSNTLRSVRRLRIARRATLLVMAEAQVERLHSRKNWPRYIESTICSKEDWTRSSWSTSRLPSTRYKVPSTTCINRWQSSEPNAGSRRATASISVSSSSDAGLGGFTTRSSGFRGREWAIGAWDDWFLEPGRLRHLSASRDEQLQFQ